MKKFRLLYAGIASFYLMTSFLSPTTFAKDKIDLKEPIILELNYKKGEKEHYSSDINFKMKLKGFIKGYANGSMNIKALGEITEEDEGVSELELKIQKIHAEGKQNINGVENTSNVNWDIHDKDNNLAQELFKTSTFSFSINNTGEIYFHESKNSSERIIDFFPDDQVKIGDTWNSEGEISMNLNLYSDGSSTETSIKDLAFKLSGKTKYKRIDSLLISFSGTSELEDVDGKVITKGDIIYDPITKKVLSITGKINADYSILIDEEDEKTKTDCEIKCDFSLKKD